MLIWQPLPRLYFTQQLHFYIQNNQKLFTKETTMANQWFRLYNDICTDIKIKLLAFEDRWHYVAILSFKSSGELDKEYPNDLKDRMIAMHLGLSLSESDGVKKRLSEVGLIDQNWQPIKWDYRQFISDSSAERTRKYRQNKAHAEDETSQDSHSDVTVTPPDNRIQNTDNIIQSDNKEYVRKRTSFTKPTIEEIKERIAEMNYNIDAERFFNYYESNGWMVGRSKMKSWQSALANWAKEKPRHQPQQSSNRKPPGDWIREARAQQSQIKDAEVIS